MGAAEEIMNYTVFETFKISDPAIRLNFTEDKERVTYLKCMDFCKNFNKKLNLCQLH